jgi:hypothetical protein
MPPLSARRLAAFFGPHPPHAAGRLASADRLRQSRTGSQNYSFPVVIRCNRSGMRNSRSAEQALNSAAEDEGGLLLGKFVRRTFLAGDFLHEFLIRSS